MMKVILFTSHYYKSKNRAGFHWIAQELHRKGHQVVFVTTPVTPINLITKTTNVPIKATLPFSRKEKIASGFYSYIWLTPLHPFKIGNSVVDRCIGYASSILYAKWPFTSFIKHIYSADMVVFESNHALMLFDRVRRMNPNARYIYRMSDDLELMAYNDKVRAEEQRWMECFNLVSVPSNYMYNKYSHKGQLRLQHHGLSKEAFDQVTINPYSGKNNAVFVGMSQLNQEALRILAESNPQWTFHVIGPFDRLHSLSNIIYHGRMAFEDTVAYIKHADIGLQLMQYSKGAESFSDTLKVIQYTYCKLPIVAPSFLTNNRENMCYYDDSEIESVALAFDAAVNMRETAVDYGKVSSWSEVVDQLLDEGS